MKGKVYLVGAGPGDEKLITVKGLEIISKADSIVYDELANDSFLKYAKEECEVHYVGKKSRNHTLSQDEINKLLVSLAKEGKIVVRLKGGDPFVFGRGGEEGQALKKEGILFEIIPGITSAIGGLTYAGIPITHRDSASSFHVITGHLKSPELELDYELFAKLEGTLVFLMGVENLENICNKLIFFGKKKDTLAGIIYRGTSPKQRVIVSTLEDLPKKAREGKIEPPSLIVIGDVIKYREDLSFYEEKALFGKKIIVTRSRTQNSSLVEKIQDLGGYPISCPVLKIKPIYSKELTRAVKEIYKYSHIILTSTNGVDMFFNELEKEGKDARSLANSKITAIGLGTANELIKYGIKADYIPDRYVGEAVVELLEKELTSKDRILLPRSKNSRPYIVNELSKICQVDEIISYETIINNDIKEDVKSILKEEDIDYITFTSSSTVDYFIKFLGSNYKEYLLNTKLVSIGPITSNQLKSYGLNIDFEAREYTIDGIIETLIENK